MSHAPGVEGTEGAEAGPGGFRERHRQQRRREFLDTALRVVTSEGLEALTMHRVTEELRCSVGSIYHYFPSKGALMADLQGEALEVVATSLLAGQAHLEELLAARGADAELASLARPVVAARFWIAAEQVFPREIELSRRQFTAPGIVLGQDEGAPVARSALALLEAARALLDGAVEHGALRPGVNIERAVILIAGTTGAMLTSALHCWDPQVFDGGRLAEALLADLLRAWGASPPNLAAIDDLVATLAAEDHLVPVVAVDVEQ